MKFAPGTLAIAVPESGNEKIGRAATTYAAQQSCPSACVFYDGGGCYAEDGPLGKFITQPLNRAAAMRDLHVVTPEIIALEEAAAIDALTVPERGWPLRLHTVGDCSTAEAARIVAAAAARWVERGGGPVWTYTHAWRDVPREAWGEVHVLASCETPLDVVYAHAFGYATALVVEEFPSPRRYGIVEKHPAVGLTWLSPPSAEVIPCPAQTKPDVSCSSCRLCMDSGRLNRQRLTIGFAIHGTRFLQRKATLALRTPDDPNRKRTLRELIPEFERDFEREHGRLPSDAEVARALGYTPSSVWEMRKSLRSGLPTVKKRHRRTPKVKA